MRRPYCLKNPIAFVGLVVCISCVLVIMISVFRLPVVSLDNTLTEPHSIRKTRKVSKDEVLGTFGEMMLEMLPDDLAFTVFIPSEEAFERDLKLRVNESLGADKISDNTYAVISRILGFSAIPRRLFSDMVSSNKGVSYDSLSGFILYISKDADGMLVVNRIRSRRLDVKRKEIVVHIMDGVVMDAEFELSVQPDYNEEG
ncbi:Fasciclin-like arabinogalactan family protein [Euphorbia peplus]|nr:Fasciclin-like arabinogalactan family protein [Euphorbia peplus]